MESDPNIKACLDLAAFSAGRFDARRDFEWKVTVGVWTVLAVSVGFSYGKAFTIPWWFIPAVTSLHAFWVRGVYVGNQNDIKKAYHFREQAELCLLNSDHKVTPSPTLIKRFSLQWHLGFLSNWATGFEVLVTAGLATAACMVSRLG